MENSLNKEILWVGNLNDDCTAIWKGLKLRAEWMNENLWWWCVYDTTKNDLIIDSSNYYDHHFISAEQSRKKAEEVAKNYKNET